MKINTNSFIAKLYKWNFNELPNDFCSLFWGSVFGILLAPFVGAFWLTNENWKFKRTSFAPKWLIGVVIWVVVLIASGVGIKVISNYWPTIIDDVHIIIALLIGIVVVGIIVALIFAAIAGIIWIVITSDEVISSKTQSFRENSVDVISTIKGRYCAMITWVDQPSTK